VDKDTLPYIRSETLLKIRKWHDIGGKTIGWEKYLKNIKQ
jgi:hypothetical protein